MDGTRGAGAGNPRPSPPVTGPMVMPMSESSERASSRMRARSLSRYASDHAWRAASKRSRVTTKGSSIRLGGRPPSESKSPVAASDRIQSRAPVCAVSKRRRLGDGSRKLNSEGNARGEGEYARESGSATVLLTPGMWTSTSTGVRLQGKSLASKANSAITRFKLGDGEESLAMADKLP